MANLACLEKKYYHDRAKFEPPHEKTNNLHM